MNGPTPAVEQAVEALKKELDGKYGLLEYVKRGILAPEYPLLSVTAPFDEHYGDCNFFAFFTERALRKAAGDSDVSVLLINIPYVTPNGQRSAVQHTMTRLRGGYVIGFSPYDATIMGKTGMAREKDLRIALDGNIRQEIGAAEFERSVPIDHLYLRLEGDQLMVESFALEGSIPVIANNYFPLRSTGVMRCATDGTAIELGVRKAKGAVTGRTGTAFELRVCQDLFDERGGFLRGIGDLTERFMLPLENAAQVPAFLEGKDGPALYDCLMSDGTPFIHLPSSEKGDVNGLKETMRENADVLLHALAAAPATTGAEHFYGRMKRLAEMA